MIAFVGALGLVEIDLLCFSIGGFVAHEMALVRPTLVRRLVLAATGPKGAPGMHGWREDIAAAARGESKPENLLYIVFAHTDASQAKGIEFLGRFTQRQPTRSPGSQLRVTPWSRTGSTRSRWRRSRTFVATPIYLARAFVSPQRRS
jgi:pimeloyl-ACP methyl ester carboxylesterase